MSDAIAEDGHVTANGVRLHYRARGRAGCPPLLILHGLTGHAWEFDGIAAALADDLHVFAVNQRGHGASAWADDYAPETMADDIAAFADALQLPPVRLVGHSMGGITGWWLAARHPERVARLVIIDIAPEVIAADAVRDYWLEALDRFAEARFADPEEAVRAYLAEYGNGHEDALRAFVLNNLVTDSDGRRHWRFDARGLIRWIEAASASAEAQREALRQVACPTLVVRAGDSPVTTAAGMERLAEEIPAARLAEIAGSGHDIHIEQPAALLAELRPFLLPGEPGSADPHARAPASRLT